MLSGVVILVLIRRRMGSIDRRQVGCSVIVCAARDSLPADPPCDWLT